MTRAHLPVFEKIKAVKRMEISCLFLGATIMQVLQHINMTIIIIRPSNIIIKTSSYISNRKVMQKKYID